MQLYIINTMYNKLVANIHMNGEKNETISSKVRNERRESTLSTFIQHSTRIANQNNKTGRVN
jgi:hypothetical protein